jgi:hypothetical protein
MLLLLHGIQLLILSPSQLHKVNYIVGKIVFQPTILCHLEVSERLPHFQPMPMHIPQIPHYLDLQVSFQEHMMIPSSKMKMTILSLMMMEQVTFLHTNGNVLENGTIMHFLNVEEILNTLLLSV